MGYSHLVAFDHVLGADPSKRPGWKGYTIKVCFMSHLCFLVILPPLPTGTRYSRIILPQRRQPLWLNRQQK